MGQTQDMVDKANTLYRECRFNKVMPILKDALGKAKCKKHKKSINDKIKQAKRRHEYEKHTIDLFNEANGLYKKSTYGEALAKLRQALEHTECQRFRDSLGKKIAIVQGKIESGETEGEEQQDVEQEQEREQRQQAASCATLARQNSCATLVQQIRNQAEEIRRRVQHYSSLSDATPLSPPSQLGPAACRVVEAEKRYQDIWVQAKNADCTEATRIKHPYGISTDAIRLKCWRYRGR